MTKTISIHGVKFEVSTPYEQGHVLTAIEAGQLNQTRAENIGNNCRAKVKEALEIENEGEREKALAEVTAILANYDKTYVFTAPGVRRAASSLDPTEKAAQKIARNYVLGKIKEAGFKSLKEYLAADPGNQDKYDANVAKVMEAPAVVKQAKEKVRLEAKEAELSLEDLAA